MKLKRIRNNQMEMIVLNKIAQMGMQDMRITYIQLGKIQMRDQKMKALIILNKGLKN